MKNFIIIDTFNFSMIAIGATRKDGGSFESALEYMINKIMYKFGYDSKYYACWDSVGGTQFRKNIDSSYKANRVGTFFPIEAVRETEKIYKKFGMENLSLDETEGDDTIYVLAKELRKKFSFSHITIISRDRDLLQIVQKGYADDIYDYCKKDFIEIPWYSIIDYKSIVGDKSDNLIGVRGIGDVGAKKILGNLMVGKRIEELLAKEQLEQFYATRKIVDSSLHPLLERNTNLIKEII